MTTYVVKENVINHLANILNDDNATKEDIKNILESLKQSEIKEDERYKQRKATSTILDIIVNLHPEFSELPFMAMKDIVEKHIITIIAELALLEKQREKEILERGHF